MSDITGTPPSPPTQPSGGQGSGPDRIIDARFNKDQKTPDESGGKGDQKTPEREVPTARFDPPVAVAPSLLHLVPGDEIKGEITRIDPEQRPILDTRSGTYALEPDAGLKARDAVLIRIDEVDRKTIGTLVEKNSAPVEAQVQVTLTLLTLHETPDARAVIEADKAPADVPPAYHSPGANPPPNAERDLQSSLLALSSSTTLSTGAPAEARSDSLKPAIQAPHTHQTPQTPGPIPTSGLVSVLAAGEAPVPPKEIGGTTGEVPEAIPGAAVSQVPGTQAPIPQALVGKATTSYLPKPGQELAGRLVTASTSATALPPSLAQIAALKPGTALTLTVLGAGETAGHTAHQGLVLQGTIVTAGQLAVGAHIGSPSPGAGAPLDIAAGPTPAAAQVGGIHYLQTDAGALLFHAPEGGGVIAPGTPLTVAVTIGPGASQAVPIAGATAAPLTATPSADASAQTPSQILSPGTAAPVIENPEAIAKQIVDSVRLGVSQSISQGMSQGISQGIAPGTTPTGAAPDTGQTVPTTGQPAAELSSSQPLPPLPPLPPLAVYAAAWPVLEELMAAVGQTDPTAQAIASARMPAPNQRFPNTFLFFLTALGMRQPTAWFGERATKAMEALRDIGLLKRFSKEFTRLGRVTRDAPGTEWRPFIVPMQHDGGTHAIVVLTRPHGEPRQHGGKDGDEDAPDDLGSKQRFLMEFNLSRLGRMQLDGLMQPGRLDLVVRAGAALSPDMQGNLRDLYTRAIEGENIEGSLGFEPLSRSPIDVQDILAKAIPEDHRAVEV